MDDLLDDIDRHLVRLLQEDGRRSVPDLAERVGIGRATAYQRLGRLRDRGVIQGFTARVDPAKLGLHLSALILIRAEQHAWRDLAPQLLSLPGVEWLGATAGEFDFALLVRVADVTTLRDVVLDGLQALPTVRSSQTVLLLEDHRLNA
ncbi:MAG: Lrp/AsnC family transcriptional regulator [Acidimicrobiales bacterium]